MAYAKEKEGWLEDHLRFEGRLLTWTGFTYGVSEDGCLSPELHVRLRLHASKMDCSLSALATCAASVHGA